MLGDFSRFGKSTWRFGSSHVPLIVAGPEVTENVTTDALCDLTDITATILDFADCDPLPDMTGRSLRSLLSGGTDTHRGYVRSALGDWSMVFDGRYKLVTQDGSTPMLFDLEADPHEERDVAAKEPGVVDRLAAM